jgi:hypothetical protein
VMSAATNAVLELLVTCTTCGLAKPRAAFFAERLRKAVSGSGVRGGHNRSRCKECERARYEDRKHRDPARFMFYRVKYRAQSEGIPFDLAPSDIFIPTHCPVLGIELAPVWAPQGTDAKPTLDRLTPSLGYVRGNIEVISARANRMKSDSTVAELERIASWMRSKGL